MFISDWSSDVCSSDLSSQFCGFCLEESAQDFSFWAFGVISKPALCPRRNVIMSVAQKTIFGTSLLFPLDTIVESHTERSSGGFSWGRRVLGGKEELYS